MNKQIQQILRIIMFSGLFVVPFIPFLVSSAFFFPFITTKVFAWRIVVEIVFAAWLVLALLDVNYRPKKSYILYAVGLFLLVIGLADLFGAAPLRSLWSNFERMEGFVAILHLGMFFVVTASVFRETDWQKWWNTTLVAAFIMVLYCALQILGLKTINQGGVRVDGTLGNAIYLAVYMLFHMFIAGLFLWRQWANTLLRWSYGLLILLQGWVLYFTATRGTILGLIGGLIIIALLNIRNRDSASMRKASIAVIVALVLVIGGFWLIRNQDFISQSPVLSRFSSLTTEDIKTQGRYFVWPMAVEGFKERPILGWGQENFTYVFQKHYRAEMFALEPWFDRAHNVYLDWLVAGGLLGLLTYLGLYIALIYSLWSSNTISYTEKTILVGLVAAYTFHNLFVFDHLISYILFFSLLAYVSHLRGGESLWQKELPQKFVLAVASPIVLVALVLVIYSVNMRPLITNTALIEAMKAIQTAEFSQAIGQFKRAYNGPYLGRMEIVEQMSSNSISILNSDIPLEEKNDLYAVVTGALRDEGESKGVANDARYQLVAGSFFAATGATDEGLARLEKARELIPNKQQVYFEIGSAYINKGDRVKAYEAFKTAYELAPAYVEAKIIYLIGAVYTGDRGVENEMLSQLQEGQVVFDDRIINAYYSNGRIAEVRMLLNARIKLDPDNKTKYEELLKTLST